MMMTVVDGVAVNIHAVVDVDVDVGVVVVDVDVGVVGVGDVVEGIEVVDAVVVVDTHANTVGVVVFDDDLNDPVGGDVVDRV
jgi:hypothetical protein